MELFNLYILILQYEEIFKHGEDVLGDKEVYKYLLEKYKELLIQEKGRRRKK